VAGHRSELTCVLFAGSFGIIGNDSKFEGSADHCSQVLFMSYSRTIDFFVARKIEGWRDAPREKRSRLIADARYELYAHQPAARGRFALYSSLIIVISFGVFGLVPILVFSQITYAPFYVAIGVLGANSAIAYMSVDLIGDRLKDTFGDSLKQGSYSETTDG
jgi:hypothetical protein